VTKTKSQDISNFKGCITCRHGHFVEDLPLGGECRFNPPRQFIGRDNTNNGRHFVHVRFDDWCGKRINEVSAETVAKFEKVRPYLSSDQAYIEAERALLSGDFDLSLKLFEPLYQSGELSMDMLNKISETLHNSPVNAPDNGDLKLLYVTWLRRAADMGHPRACYFYAITLVSKDYSLLDEALSKEYLLKAAELGYGTAKKKVESGVFLKIDFDG